MFEFKNIAVFSKSRRFSFSAGVLQILLGFFAIQGNAIHLEAQKEFFHRNLAIQD